METGRTPSTNGEGFLSRMALNDNKAGMEGLDRDKINKIIMESSKGSRFYENEVKREQQVNQRVERMMLQKTQITEQQLSKAHTQLEKMTADLEKGRELSRVIVHVDMDAFYAAVEMRDCPDLKDKPMAVGSTSMLSTSNYHARKFGVRAAMPGFIAKKLCPNLVIVPTNFDKYKAVSAEVREIFADYDPHFQSVSLDEAYLDISDHLQRRRSWSEALRSHSLHTITPPGAGEGQGEFSGPTGEGLSPVLFEDSPGTSPSAPPGEVVVFGTCAEEAVREMRFRIEQKTTLTASAGIGPNMMLAKVCSDKNKPNGQYRLLPNRQTVMDFVKDLPVRKVSGIGKVTEKMLGALGIITCGHLNQEMALVSLLFSETSWLHFLQISLGLGSTHIERDGERKSMSTERTFGEMNTAEEQLSLCQKLCQDLAEDLKKEALQGKTVTLKLKNVNFEVKSRAETQPCALATAEEIFAVAKDLLKTEIDSVSPQPLRLRLMGVRISAFVSSDDKKPLQKSIVGFLQQGRADPSGPSQVPARKGKEEPIFKSPVQSQTSGCPPLAEHTPGQREATWRASRRGVEEGRPEGQSFFQRAHAQRLRLQAERGDTQGDGDSPTDATGTNPQTADPSSKSQTSTEPGPDASTASASGLSFEAQASTSAWGSSEPEAQTDSLTCPICFREVRTTDLAVFNRHIDQCLSGVSAEPNHHQPDSEPHSNMERGRILGEEEAAEREMRTTEEDMDSSRRPDSAIPRLTETLTLAMTARISQTDRLDSNSPRDRCVLPDSSPSVPRAPESMTSESRDVRGPALTCPVCQVTQHTDDLTIFNRHVDLCLNQGMLHELGGRASVGQPPFSVTHSKVKESEPPLQRTTHRGKSKRRGSSLQPHAKKAKAPGPQNTIDRFFR
ncbi:DNA polymerase kappa [Osmerus eperlanus]|uniref:DNA polymerase kappa n=1 Tax=Osmerus eperlanus TaxID=29151 RepID=UPI002E130F3C